MRVTWIVLLVLLGSQAGKGSFVGKGSSPLALVISVRPGATESGCSGPVFTAAVRNATSKPIWLDLGATTDALEPIAYSFCNLTRYGGECGDVAIGRTDDWGDIDYLRSAKATRLAPGAAAKRRIAFDDADFRVGRLKVSVTIRVHGTADLTLDAVQTYEPKATAKVHLVVREDRLELRGR